MSTGKWKPAKNTKTTGSLGLPYMNAPAMVHLIESGLPFSRLAKFQTISNLPWEQIAKIIRIPPRTLARRKITGRLLPEESDRVLRLATVFDLAVDLFVGDARAARQWLMEPAPALGNATPLDFAATEVGAREVERLIGRLEHGVFT